MRGYSLLEVMLVIALLAAAMTLFTWPSPPTHAPKSNIAEIPCAANVQSVRRAHQNQLLFSNTKEQVCANDTN